MKQIQHIKFIIWFAIFIIGLATVMFIDDVAGTTVLAIGVLWVLVDTIVSTIFSIIEWLKERRKK